MTRMIFTPHEHVIDSGKPLYPPRELATEAERNVWLALGTLTDRQREIVEAKIYEELSFKEIGERLNISKQAAHAAYSIAIALMRKDMTP